jgi:fructose-bisphosphate aldolase / 2-amino-3,7-dideoxy-D-threo-hept-6-ulosonate synthase
MPSTGKILRLRRIFDRKSENVFMFAISHGTSAPTVLPGLEKTRQVVDQALSGGANLVFLSRGYVEQLTDVFEHHPNASIALKASSSAANASVLHQEVPIASAEEALRIGADALVALLPFAPDNEVALIEWSAEMAEDCLRIGMPFIAEAEYPASYGQQKPAFEMTVDYLKRSARLSEELGADIVKSNWTGSVESFREIVKCVQVPVVVAGGSKESDRDLLTKIDLALQAGARGCSVGRNIFQHENPETMARAISKVVHRHASVDEALREMRSATLQENHLTKE